MITKSDGSRLEARRVKGREWNNNRDGVNAPLPKACWFLQKKHDHTIMISRYTPVLFKAFFCALSACTCMIHYLGPLVGLGGDGRSLALALPLSVYNLIDTMSVNTPNLSVKVR